MNQESLAPKLEELYLDTLDLLKRINDLIDTANEISIFNIDTKIDKIKKYEYFKHQMEITSHKVQNLELRMAIVAPTNAGKSTIINAIIGKETLPSRSTAMTTIPTEVFLNSESSKPFLEIKEETLEIFQDTITTLKAKFDDIASSNITEDISIKYSELTDTIEKIKNQELIINGLVYEYAEIQSQLKILNDIILICQILIPSHNPLGKIIAFPRIQTKSWYQSLDNNIVAVHNLDKSLGKLSGKLIVIDTPGPNEILENPEEYSLNPSSLWSAVKEQLQQSSIVVFVVDFTKLREKQDSQIIKEIQEIQRINNNLYILVNKIDRRQDGDIELEPLYTEVISKFNLNKDVFDIDNKVFPISAIGASIAINCFVDLADCPNDKDVSDKESAKKLAKVFQPFTDPNIFLKGKTKQDLLTNIEQMLESSKFKPFIEKTLKIMIEEAAPRSIADALNTSIFLLKDLSDKVGTQKCFIKTSEIEINNQIVYLNEDREKFKLLQEYLDDVIENLNKKFTKQIIKIISTDFQEKIVKKLDSNFSNKTNYDVVYYLDLINEHQNNKDILKAAIQQVDQENKYYSESINLLVDFVSNKQTSITGYPQQRIIFKTKKNAQEFSIKVKEELQDILQSTFVIDEQEQESYEHRIREEIKKIQEEFWDISISLGSERVINNVRNRFGEFGMKSDLSIDREMFFRDYTPDVGETSKPKEKRKWLRWGRKIGSFIGNFIMGLLGQSYNEDNEEQVEYYFSTRDIYVPTTVIRKECEEIEKEIIQETNAQLGEQKQEFYEAVSSLLNECENNLLQALEKRKKGDLREQKLDDLSLKIDDVRIATQKRHKFAKQIIK